MRVAVASNQSKVAEHFSKCEGYRIYEFNGNTIDVHDYLEQSPDLKGRLADLLSQMGIETVIAGGIGSGQIEKLKERGIVVISGITGEVSDAIFKLHRGELVSAEAPNQDHGCGGSGGSGGCCGSHGAEGSSGGCGCHGA